MKWAKRFPLWLLFCAALAGLFTRSGQAQLSDPRCPAVVETALSQLGDNCAGLSTNSACYGYTRVDATFTDQVLAANFTKPTDRTEIANLISLRTATVNPDLSQWGIAVLNAQADIPDTLPGQNVTFLLVGEAEIENAAEDDEATFKPMQAFYFRTGFGAPTCGEAPSVLALRSPEGIKVNLTANGAEMEVGSMVMMRTLPPGNVMEMATIEGNVILDPNGANPITLPAGFSSNRCLSLPENLGGDGNVNDRQIYDTCPWTPPRPITQQQSNLALLIDQTFQALDGNITTPNIPTNASDQCPGGSTVHTVSAQENLFRIALRYQTSMEEIARANGLSNLNVVSVGQQLTIPCVGSGFVNVPAQPIVLPPIITPGVTPPAVNCTGFRATSPLDGFPAGTVTFYWNPAPSASSYVVNVFNESGANVGTFTSTGTNVSADTGRFGNGFLFSWEVIALSNGTPICSSGRISAVRASPDIGSNEDDDDCPSTASC
jgi:LysM repeat protein